MIKLVLPKFDCQNILAVIQRQRCALMSRKVEDILNVNNLQVSTATAAH